MADIGFSRPRFVQPVRLAWAAACFLLPVSGSLAQVPANGVKPDGTAPAAVAAPPVAAPPGAVPPAATPDIGTPAVTAPAPAATTPATSASAAGTAPTKAPAGSAAAAPSLPAGPPGDLAGDRADAIARDVIATPPQKQKPPKEASRLHTEKLKLNTLLDRSVHGREDSEIGRVIDVLTGDDGRPQALVLDVGGFMGVGNRRIAVAWPLFDISALKDGKPLRVMLSEEAVKSAPAVENSGPVTVVTGSDFVVGSADGQPKADEAQIRVRLDGLPPAHDAAGATAAAVPLMAPNTASTATIVTGQPASANGGAASGGTNSGAVVPTLPQPAMPPPSTPSADRPENARPDQAPPPGPR